MHVKYGTTNSTTVMTLEACLSDADFVHDERTATVAVYQTGALDGTPVFFPIDGDDSPAAAAETRPRHHRVALRGDHELSAGDAGEAHNFSFTSEIRYWFPYDSTKTYTLEFLGDDDVWMFVNKTACGRSSAASTRRRLQLAGRHLHDRQSSTARATTLE